MRTTSLATVLLAACLSENDVSNQQNVDTFEQAPNNEVDILWIVDDSFSMGNEQATLAAGFESFANELDSSGTAFHLGVVTTSFEGDDRGALVGDPPYLLPEDENYVQLFQQRASVGIHGSDYEKGLAVAVWATSSTMATAGAPNEYFVRSYAPLVVIIVSDEEDCSDNGALDGQPPEACYWQEEELAPVTQFVNDLRTRKGGDDRVTISVIVGKPESECEDIWTGSRYIQAANMTGGHVGDICESTWEAMLAEMGLRVAGVRDQFQLSKGAVPHTIEVEVDEVEVGESATEGWTYDAVNRYLQFHGEAVPERGSIIVVRYTIDPGYVAP